MYGTTFPQIVCYFIIYSLLGWIVEVAYHAITMGKVVNRGFLNGPVCPVYGCGMLIVLGLASWVSEGDIQNMNLWLLFGTGCVFATLAELIAGWILDKLFHARWWDYSGEHFNLDGYICLKFCLIWGLAITFAVRQIHPTVAALTEKILSHGWTTWLLVATGVVFIADIAVSTAIACGMDRHLHDLDEAAKALRALSDPASEIITGSTLKVVQPMQKGRVQAALAGAELREAAQERREELRKKAAWFSGNAWFGRRRLVHAYPGLKHHRYAEGLEALRRHIRGEKEDA